MVLNPTLYRRLERAFGPVKVDKPNVAMAPPPISVTHVFDFIHKRRQHLEVLEFGEMYRVCCPYCDDTRHRLYVNHMYGKKDAGGRVLRFLRICYNEDCFDSEENRDDFEERMKVLDSELGDAKVAPGRRLSTGEMKADWPGPCRNLRDLPKGHKARAYVEGRRLDPDVLGRFYGVSFCVDSMYYLARQRLVIPIYWLGKFVGWQTRYVGELPWKDAAQRSELPPKYWTMPNLPRSQILCNYDHARKYHTGVLVEGWFDTFGLGPMAMPVLGNTISEQQINTFVSTWHKRAGVWLLDPEEYETKATAAKVARLRKAMSHFAAVRLPAGTDPGSLDRAFCRAYVTEQAAAQGVQVSWRKV